MLPGSFHYLQVYHYLYPFYSNSIKYVSDYWTEIRGID